jgi:C1A family cysteine protease
MLAEDAQREADRLRQGASTAAPILRSEAADSQDVAGDNQPENETQRDTDGTANGNTENRPENGAPQDYAPAVASWIASTYGSIRNVPEPQVKIEGAKFAAEKPKKNDARTANYIVAKSINLERDNKVGVPMSRYNLNYVFAEPDDRDHVFSDIFGTPDPNYLPATTDLRSTWGDVLDQLDLGSCVSNSVAYAVRYCFRKQKLGDFTPSRLFVYYNGRQIGGYPIEEDTGLSIRDGYKSVAKYSACSEQNWPYATEKFAERPSEECYEAARQHRTFRYIRLDNDVNQIKKCLKDGYPVSFGAAIFSSFMSADAARTGAIPVPNPHTEERVGGHAMTILGHDDTKEAFLVANNWGESWGEGGFCWFPYTYMVNDDLVGDLWSPRWFS